MKKYIILLILAVFIISTQVFLGIKIFCYFGLPDKAGEFGDAFGAINTLFSGLAFCGVIYAVILQSKELELQRNELSRSAEAQQKQAELILLSAKINAAISKQEILASFLVNEKIFPDYEKYNFGEYRTELKELMAKTDSLIKE